MLDASTAPPNSAARPLVQCTSTAIDQSRPRRALNEDHDTIDSDPVIYGMSGQGTSSTSRSTTRTRRSPRSSALHAPPRRLRRLCDIRSTSAQVHNNESVSILFFSVDELLSSASMD